MRLIPQTAMVSADDFSYRGQNLLALSDKEYREKILWKAISLVPQSAMDSLNPVYRVGARSWRPFKPMPLKQERDSWKGSRIFLKASDCSRH